MSDWENVNIPYNHGVALSLIGALDRDDNIWTGPEWVINNYPKHKHIFEGLKEVY